MERTPEDDAPSPAETSAEVIRPNQAVAGVARVSKADRVREWRRRARNTDEARAKEAERKRLQRVRNIDETRAKEAEWKRRQRKANAGESSTSSATSRKRRAPPADPEAFRRRTADRVRRWRAARAVRDAASNAGADARFRREFLERSNCHQTSVKVKAVQSNSCKLPRLSCPAKQRCHHTTTVSRSSQTATTMARSMITQTKPQILKSRGTNTRRR